MVTTAGELTASAASPTQAPSRTAASATAGLRDLLPPELAAAEDLREVAPADARELTRVLL
ncbi:RNA polymerase sigma factor SigF, partial [Kitasatospora sp. NPDC002543]